MYIWRCRGKNGYPASFKNNTDIENSWEIVLGAFGGLWGQMDLQNHTNVQAGDEKQTSNTQTI